jgi:hypothetical protein
MLSISLDFKKKISSLGKEIEIRLQNIKQEEGDRLAMMLEEFQPQMVEIAKTTASDFDLMASKKFFEGFKSPAILHLADTITIKLINDARDPNYELYYWQVINGGRGAGKKAPPAIPYDGVNEEDTILGWMKSRGIGSQRRSPATGRFLKSGGLEEGKKRQAYAIARKIGKDGIAPKPEVFNLMRNKIYIEIRKRIMAISGV